MAPDPSASSVTAMASGSLGVEDVGQRLDAVVAEAADRVRVRTRAR